MLPVDLKCTLGHPFTARTSKLNGKGTTDCPVCRKETGRRTAVRITKRAIAEALARQRGEGGEGSGGVLSELEAERQRLAELWAAEAPAAPWRKDLEGDAGQPCGKCGAPRQWAGARTVLICLACNTRAASPGAYRREADYAAAQARKRQGSAEIERPRDRAAERNARVRRRALADELRQICRELERLGDPGKFSGDYLRQQALELGKTARALMPEVDDALRADMEAPPDAGEAELAELAETLRALAASPEVDELQGELEQAEWARQTAELEAQAEAEAERRRQQRAELEQQQRRALEQRRPLALPPGTSTRPSAQGATNPVLAEVLRRQQAIIERYGPCPYHMVLKVAPTRLYAARDQYTGGPWAGGIQVAACRRHYGLAASDVQAAGYKVFYWELSELMP